MAHASFRHAGAVFFFVHVSIIIFFQIIQFRVLKLVVRFPGRDTVVFAQKVSADPP